MPSVAETVEWRTPLPDDLPGLRWSVLEGQGATAQVVIDGAERHEVPVGADGDFSARVDGGELVVEVAPKALPPGRYRLQAVIRHDGRQYVTPEEPERIYLRDAIV